MPLALLSAGSYLEEGFFLCVVTQLHHEAHFLPRCQPRKPLAVVTSLSRFQQRREGGLKDRNMQRLTIYKRYVAKQCLWQDVKGPDVEVRYTSVSQTCSLSLSSNYLHCS